MKPTDKVDERQEDQATEAAQNMRMEAYAASSTDKTGNKVEKAEDFTISDSGDVAQKLIDSVQRIASLSSRLPANMLDDLVASSNGVFDNRLLAVVKNPQNFQLGDSQKPEDVQAFLNKITA